MSQQTKIAGVTVVMGGREFVVPPLTLGQVKRLTPEIAALSRSTAELDPAGLDAVCKVMHAALSRNYPDMKIEELEDLLDMGNIALVTNALMGVSGLVPSGEAAGETGRSTGAGSTPTS